MASITFNDKAVRSLKLFPNGQTTTSYEIKKLTHVDAATGVETPIWQSSPLSIKAYACSYSSSDATYFNKMYKCQNGYAIFFTSGNTQVRYFNLNGLREGSTNNFTTQTLNYAAKAVTIYGGVPHYLSVDGTTITDGYANWVVGTDIVLPSSASSIADINMLDDMLFLTVLDSNGTGACVIPYERNLEDGAAWVAPTGYEPNYYKLKIESDLTTRVEKHIGTAYDSSGRWDLNRPLEIYRCWFTIGRDDTSDSYLEQAMWTALIRDPNTLETWQPYNRYYAKMKFGANGSVQATGQGNICSSPYGHLQLLTEIHNAREVVYPHSAVLFGLRPPLPNLDRGRHTLISISECSFDYQENNYSQKLDSINWSGSMSDGNNYANVGTLAIYKGVENIYVILAAKNSASSGGNNRIKLYSTTIDMDTGTSDNYNYKFTSISENGISSPDTYVLNVPGNVDLSPWWSLGSNIVKTTAAAMSTENNKFWLYKDGSLNVWWCFEIEEN